ncbi:xanthine dehydrogenase family protein subunit M [Pseudoruegeria sp. SK021]|uniref:FAD binding domain-containing protein n=1 Tax=Pseudoruegeria sp. SK021 TaxID=1933035 RepID=UPI000A24B42F|nr:FAD binding domain-containing protein [Pseudoruegeria sp. SK021]OSP53929.1 oxidoreductase [Pseudoruegeria sp. SK021]
MQTVETHPTLAGAAAAMRERSRYIAGGTLVMRAMNYGATGIETLLRSGDAALREIRHDSGGIRIGAGVTMAEVIASRELDFLAPVARVIGGPAIRNMATVGGNLFAAHPYGDFTVALLALDAQVIWADGHREGIEPFLAGRSGTRGLVAAVQVPRPATGEFRFHKVSRVKPKGVSVMSIAGWLPMAAGRVGAARLAFGAMGPTPLRAKAAEAALRGVTLDADGIAPAVRVAAEGLAPADDALASAWYRREVAPVHLKRLLLAERRV